MALPLMVFKSLNFEPLKNQILINSTSLSRTFLEAGLDVIRFRPPLKMNQVEDLLQKSIFGSGPGELLKIHQTPIIRPKGGTLYLCSSSIHFYEDGYNWTEVSKQVLLTSQPLRNCWQY